MSPSEQHIFFELLRASIWQREADLSYFHDSSWSWSPILRALDSHSLLALAAGAIMTVNYRLPASQQLNPSQSMELMKYCATVAQTHFDLNNAVIKSFAKLQDAGCHPLLLKGQGLATLYPIRNTRSCGDIDVYVGLGEYEKACSVIKQMINNPEAEANAEEEFHHYEIHDGDVIYEIHRYPSVAGNPRYQEKYYKLSSEYLKPDLHDCVNIETVSIPVPVLQYNVLYVFNHLCQHLWEGGVGVRQFIDWMLLLNSAINGRTSSFDLSTLQSNLKAVGLYRAWRILGGILVYQLGFPKDLFPFWDEVLASKSQGYYIDELLGGCSFGTMSGQDNSYKMRTGIQRKIEALKHFYFLCRPVSIISNRFAIERFIFFLKEAVLRPGRN